MNPDNNDQDKVIEELQQIKSLLQDILIILGKSAGLKMSKVREMLGVANKRVSSIWQHLEVKNEDDKDLQ